MVNNRNLFAEPCHIKVPRNHPRYKDEKLLRKIESKIYHDEYNPQEKSLIDIAPYKCQLEHAICGVCFDDNQIWLKNMVIDICSNDCTKYNKRAILLLIDIIRRDYVEEYPNEITMDKDI